jgi:glycosyltransferase involved in cell wall biosynthesis
MRVAMVNDCAYVGETILKYLPANIEKTHIKRSRGIWSKTFGIAYKIWKTKADIYHVNYLLQDCYLASIFNKKPLIGHAHGSDLRQTLNRFPLARIVGSNLRKCDKILVSTPDLAEIVRQYREDVEYLPNPVDTGLFYPKPAVSHEGKSRVLIGGGANLIGKGTDVALHAMARLKDEVEVSFIGYGKDLEKALALARSLALKVRILPRVPHQDLNEYYWNADVVLDQFKCGVLGLVALEAIACGRPVVTYVSSKYPEYCDLPLKDVDTSEEIIAAIRSTNDLTELWRTQYTYFKENHNTHLVVEKMLRIYKELCGA